MGEAKSRVRIESLGLQRSAASFKRACEVHLAVVLLLPAGQGLAFNPSGFVALQDIVDSDEAHHANILLG